MKTSRFSEQQRAFIFKQAEDERGSRRCAGRRVSRSAVGTRGDAGSPDDLPDRANSAVAMTSWTLDVSCD